MTPLERLLRDEIAATGPMPLAQFMAACLMHPRHGYYATRDPFGQAGDFITAPEISQMFGELLGLSLAQAWMDQGAPAPFGLVELGPGRGTLMADIRRATQTVPGFAKALDGIHMVEASPALRERQAEANTGAGVTWHDTCDSLPEMPLFTVANEFFDALPVQQFTRAEAGWQEHVIGLDKDGLRMGLGPPVPVDKLAHRLEDTRPGDVVETVPAAGPVIRALGTRIADHGGVALIVDYGDWRSLGDTLQGVRGHDRQSPLSAPGLTDLSAHVDFEMLARAVPPGCTHSRLTPQGVFLERLGVTARAQALACGLTGNDLDQHIAAHRRLTHPDEMGTLFKAMALYPQGAQPPPGLEP